MTTAGFPHSDTLGSPFGCQLPEAYRRLPRPSSAPDAKASTMRPYPLDHHTTTHHTPRQNRRKRGRRTAPSREPQKTKGIYSTNITTKMLASTVQFSNNNRIPPQPASTRHPPTRTNPTRWTDVQTTARPEKPAGPPQGAGPVPQDPTVRQAPTPPALLRSRPCEQGRTSGSTQRDRMPC